MEGEFPSEVITRSSFSILLLKLKRFSVNTGRWKNEKLFSEKFIIKTSYLHRHAIIIHGTMGRDFNCVLSMELLLAITNLFMYAKS